MIGLILSSVPLAIGIAMSPLAIVAIIVLLAQGNRRGALWFLLGWVAGLALLTSLVAIFGQDIQPHQRDAVRPWVAPVQIAVGLGLVIWVIVTFVRKRNAPPPNELPKMLQAVDALGAAQSFGMATFMAFVNAKNIALLLAFLLALLSSPRPIVWTVASVATFITLASITIVVPVLYALVKGDAAEPMLEKWRTWMMVHQSTIMNGFIGIVGIILIVQGLNG